MTPYQISMSTAIDYKILFQCQSVPTLVLQPDDPQFTIMDANPAFLEATNSSRPDLIGHSLFAAFPENPSGKRIDSVYNLDHSLRQVLSTGASVALPLLRYDIPLRGTGLFEEKHWKPVFSPLHGQEGKVMAILVQVQDLTQSVKEGALFSERECDLTPAPQDWVAARELFQTLVQTINGIFWESDAKTSAFRYVSPQVHRLLGYTPEEWLADESFWQKHLHPDDREMAIHYCHDQTCQGQNHHFEYRFLHASGHYRWYQDMVTVIMEAGEPHLLRGLMVDITDKKQMEQELAAQKALVQKRVTSAYIQAQEQERNELGRELHDNINQVLASVKLYLNIAMEEDSKREIPLPKCFENISYAMEEIRKLCYAMVAPSLGSKTLFTVLQELTEEYNLSRRIKLHLSYEVPDAFVLDQQMELTIFRIVQEQLNNIGKHAEASEASIAVYADQHGLHVLIADNGKGFQVSRSTKGIGLMNIQHRVAYYNGSVRIDAAPGKGCRLAIALPMDPA